LDTLEILHHVKVSNADNAIAKRLQLRGAADVGGGIRVGFTVHLDNQTLLRAKEVNNGGANHSLPTEPAAAQLRAREDRPKALFRLCRFIAHGAGVVIQTG